MKNLKSKFNFKFNLKFNFKYRKQIIGFLFSGFAFILFLPFQNCAVQDLEFSQIALNTEYAYVYGQDDQDQQLLSERIQGYERPSLSQIFNNWSRISGSLTYQKAEDVIVEDQYAFCKTTLDENGNWLPTVNPADGRVINNPGLGICTASETFSAISWSYLSSSDSLKCAVNANKLVGFVSGVPFDNYENEAIVSSPDTDDDSILLIIATTKDQIDGSVHSLAAVRTQGGNEPYLGWGIAYYKNGVVVKTYHNKSVGGVFITNGPGVKAPLDLRGWRGRKTIIKVLRDKDLITAYTSDWSFDEAGLALDPGSKIELDLAGVDSELEIFRGPQKYGYGTRSQYGSTFEKIKFSTKTNIERIYDLKTNRVYQLVKDGSGKYVFVSGKSPYAELGSNIYVINPQTQKAFFLRSNQTFEIVDGSEILMKASKDSN